MPKAKKSNAKTSTRVKATRATRRTSANPIATSIKRLYNKSAPLLICEALLFGVVAVLMVLMPVTFLKALTVIVGVGLILFGLYRTIAGFVVSRDMGGGWFDVLFGLLGVVLGVLFCIYPASSAISLVYIFVVLFLFRSLLSLIFSVNMIRAKFGHYWMDLIISIILIALAVILLFYPMAGALVMVYYLAVALLLYAAADVYMYIEILRLKRLTAD